MCLVTSDLSIELLQTHLQPQCLSCFLYSGFMVTSLLLACQLCRPVLDCLSQLWYCLHPFFITSNHIFRDFTNHLVPPTMETAPCLDSPTSLGLHPSSDFITVSIITLMNSYQTSSQKGEYSKCSYLSYNAYPEGLGSFWNEYWNYLIHQN